MPRGARIVSDNSYFHVLTRGNDKKKIFRAASDYQTFREIAIEYLGKFEVAMVHYCLMPNHLHLLLYTETGADMPKFMQAVLQVYARYFKSMYKGVGYVFQNRYKSIFIEKESYLLECARYIERNPERAGMVVDLEAYRWSSHAFYATGKKDGLVTKPNPLYLNMHENEIKRMNLYKVFTRERRVFEDIVDKEFAIK